MRIKLNLLSKGIPNSCSSLELLIFLLIKSLMWERSYHRSQYSVVFHDLVT